MVVDVGFDDKVNDDDDEDDNNDNELNNFLLLQVLIYLLNW
jgi:hypothetical protein